MKIKDNGILIRNLVPIKFINKNEDLECSMYDRVSEEILRNEGTWLFIIGPDKNEEQFKIYF